MLFLTATLLCLFAYKFLTKWIWIILPIALVLDTLLWIHAHQFLFWLVISLALITYDLIYRNQHHGRDPFYNK